MGFFAVADDIDSNHKWELLWDITTEAEYNRCVTLWVRCGSWCVGAMSDGYVSLDRACKLVKGSRYKVGLAAGLLVKVGLWELDPSSNGGRKRFHFSHYSDFNPTREKIQKKRRQSKLSSEKHRSSARNDSTRDMSQVGHQECHAERHSRAPESPTPTPTPIKRQQLSPARSHSNGGANRRPDSSFARQALVLAAAVERIPKLVRAFGSTDLRTVGEDMCAVLLNDPGAGAQLDDPDRRGLCDEQLRQAVAEAVGRVPEQPNELACRDAIRIQLQRLQKADQPHKRRQRAEREQLSLQSTGRRRRVRPALAPGTHMQAQPSERPKHWIPLNKPKSA